MRPPCSMGYFSHIECIKNLSDLKGPTMTNLPITEKSSGCACGCTESGIPELDVRPVPHPLRHGAVFGALSSVRPGAAMVLIAVGTPPRAAHGDADLSFVFSAARELAPLIDDDTVVVVKSTVPVGTGDIVQKIIGSVREAGTFSVASNPEFLREGVAISDFLEPIVQRALDKRRYRREKGLSPTIEHNTFLDYLADHTEGSSYYRLVCSHLSDPDGCQIQKSSETNYSTSYLLAGTLRPAY